MRILIQCGNNLENARRVHALASLLQEHGHQPVVSVYSPEYTGFFRTVGIEAVAFFEFRPRIAPSNLESETGIDIHWNDFFALDIARSEGAGTPFNLKRHVNPAARSLVGIHRLVTRQEIDSIVVWNGSTGSVANAWRTYKKAKAIAGGFIERGILPDGLFFDTQGVNGEASIAAGSRKIAPPDLAAEYEARHSAAIEAFFPDLAREPILANTGKARTKTIFVPLQVQHDSNIILHSDRVKTMRMLILEAIRLRDRYFPDFRILVRPHPEEERGLQLNIPVVDGLTITSEGHLADLLKACEVTITINSTVGFEAAVNGSLPVVLGEGIYCREDFVVRHEAVADGTVLHDRLRLLQEDPEAFFGKVRRYLAILFERNQVQPLYKRASEPTALLDALGTSDAARKNSARNDREIIDRVAGALLERQPAVIVCHVCGLHDKQVNLNYREIRVPMTFKVISSMLRCLLRRDLDCSISNVETLTSGDIAIAPDDADLPTGIDYRIVFNQYFAVHKDFRARSNKAPL
ncbi:hypothetical protein MRS76_09045 [Rhizobiaceae bacterium n13]|uniref:Capsular biosynthesis protein n=1 Tax=Ferirhizobium litorale TaxID=2927786 RepID=A0AAE3QFX2_9HYPH|nr:hypothetical protein [Fererhizobium litorale]MDI7862102.1 hypothetical protein [Fererhizobium litorale]MDI7922626.1 hypothetical protein [Fererhizobium litorale]